MPLSVGGDGVFAHRAAAESGVVVDGGEVNSRHAIYGEGIVRVCLYHGFCSVALLPVDEIENKKYSDRDNENGVGGLRQPSGEAAQSCWVKIRAFSLFLVIH